MSTPKGVPILLRAARSLHRVADSIEHRAVSARLVWIFSAPRSGTTWLLNLLSSHPKVSAVNEPLIGAHLGVTQGQVQAGMREPDALVYDAMRSNPNYVFADGTEWRGALVTLLRDRYLRPAATRLGRDAVVVLKEPHGTEAAPLLQSLLPDSKVIVLVRDPRDCLDSVVDIVEEGWMGEPGRGPLDAGERRDLLMRNAEQWRQRLHASLTVRDRLPASQSVLVRYEDLRHDTATELARITDFLSIDAPSTWIAATVERWAFDAVPAERRGPGQFHRSATPGLWREHFDVDDAAWATDYFASDLEQLGYPP